MRKYKENYKKITQDPTTQKQILLICTNHPDIFCIYSDKRMKEGKGDLEEGQVKDTYKWDPNTWHCNFKV